MGSGKKIMDRDAAHKALIKLAQHTAATWQRVRGEAFAGVTTIETSNTLYRFTNGVFSGRAKKPAGANETETAPAALAWDSPPAMNGVELIGFFANEGGLWSLSPRWREGSLAVITTNASAFTLTSATLSCVIERPEPPAAPRSVPETSDVFSVPPRRPPTVRRPAPPSMTRLQPVPTR